MKQEYILQYSSDRSGNFAQFDFQTEVTSRDKDHVGSLVIYLREHKTCTFKEF